MSNYTILFIDVCFNVFWGNYDIMVQWPFDCSWIGEPPARLLFRFAHPSGFQNIVLYSLSPWYILSWIWSLLLNHIILFAREMYLGKWFTHCMIIAVAFVSYPRWWICCFVLPLTLLFLFKNCLRITQKHLFLFTFNVRQSTSSTTGSDQNAIWYCGYGKT